MSLSLGDKSASNPNLPSNIESTNVNQRKRKCYPELEDTTSLHSDVRQMINCLKADRVKQDDRLYEAIEELRKQNKEIIKTNSNIEKILEQTTSLYSSLNDKVNKLSIEHDDALIKISNLEDQVEELHRVQKISTIEIRNIPETENENLNGLMVVLHGALQLPFCQNSLKQVRRLKNVPQKPIIAEFQTIQQSKALIQAIKEYNTSHPEDKLNTHTLELGGEKKLVYISESLTPRARKLHYFARDLRKNHNFKHCWIWQGKVLVKQTDISQAIVIRSEQQIEALKASNPAQ